MVWLEMHHKIKGNFLKKLRVSFNVKIEELWKSLLWILIPEE